MPNFWDKWFKKKDTDNPSMPGAMLYDQFTCEFAADFNAKKENKELLDKKPIEYWHLFQQERDRAWSDYRAKNQ
jgi:hypothetical protein